MMLYHTTYELGCHLLVCNVKLRELETALVVHPPGHWFLADVMIVILVISSPPLLVIHLQYVHLTQNVYIPLLLILLEPSHEVEGNFLLFGSPFLTGWHIHVSWSLPQCEL